MIHIRRLVKPLKSKLRSCNNPQIQNGNTLKMCSLFVNESDDLDLVAKAKRQWRSWQRQQNHHHHRSHFISTEYIVTQSKCYDDGWRERMNSIFNHVHVFPWYYMKVANKTLHLFSLLNVILVFNGVFVQCSIFYGVRYSFSRIWCQHWLFSELWIFSLPVQCMANVLWSMARIIMDSMHNVQFSVFVVRNLVTKIIFYLSFWTLRSRIFGYAHAHLFTIW